MTDCADNDRYAEGSDRRQWGRFVADVGEIVICPDGGKPSNAQVLDESFGGIGLTVASPLDVEVGTLIDVTYDGIPMRGIVRNVRHDDAGRQRLGIEWAAHTSCDGLEQSDLAVERCLLVLFRMWEAGHWSDLGRAAQTLASDARTSGRIDLARLAESLQWAVADPPNDVAVRTALASLVDLCTCVTA
ncbi:MAG: PilZ domain-containing protein [Pirellulales bacterium]